MKALARGADISVCGETGMLMKAKGQDFLDRGFRRGSTVQVVGLRYTPDNTAFTVREVRGKQLFVSGPGLRTEPAGVMVDIIQGTAPENGAA